MIRSTISLNSKFRSFLVWILIPKDNTDNKVFKREFYTKETRKKGIEKIKCCKFLVQFDGTYLRECPGKQSSLNLSIFLLFFLFCRKVAEFIKLQVFFKVLLAEFSVEFSFSHLTWKSFSSRLSFNVTLFLGKLHSRSK